MSQTSEDWYKATTSKTVLVELPRDDAPHDDYIEWWHQHSRLTGDSGRRYYFHFTFFLINALVTYTVAHVSLSTRRPGDIVFYKTGTQRLFSELSVAALQRFPIGRILNSGDLLMLF